MRTLFGRLGTSFLDWNRSKGRIKPSGYIEMTGNQVDVLRYANVVLAAATELDVGSEQPVHSYNSEGAVNIASSLMSGCGIFGAASRIFVNSGNDLRAVLALLFAVCLRKFHSTVKINITHQAAPVRDVLTKLSFCVVDVMIDDSNSVGEQRGVKRVYLDSGPVGGCILYLAAYMRKFCQELHDVLPVHKLVLEEYSCKFESIVVKLLSRCHDGIEVITFLLQNSPPLFYSLTCLKLTFSPIHLAD